MEMRRLHALVCLVSDCWKTRHVVGDSVTSSDCWDYAMTSSRREVDQVTNNNNIHDNVYGAVIMTKVIARVHPVHLMNAD